MYAAFILDPIINALIFLYSFFNDMGIAIILLTVLIRLILFPLSKKALIATKKIQEIQPKIKQIQEEFKRDKQRQGVEMMKIYKEANINPLLPFVNIAIQLTVLIALYQSLNISQNLKNLLPNLYSITPHPAELSHSFLGFINLSLPNAYFAVIAAAATFWQLKISMVANPPNPPSNKTSANDPIQAMQKITKQLNMVMPIITLVVALGLPAALSLYWVVSTLFTVGQEYFIKYQNSK